ncbi:hypothetical protein CYY_001278 [Polysphondylium violaceum]|uniref:Uncharacterized protein n=1 Tax=Polysphondylium violaceum TaxID=133409 RepID=A0A8J4VAR3_9MYCE|nr:hypothetical protein CYY_001278 [Polysphondylium violaceum]
MKLLTLLIVTLLLFTIKSTSCSNLHGNDNNDNINPHSPNSYFPFGETVRFDILNKDDSTSGGKGFQGKVGIETGTTGETTYTSSAKVKNPSLLNEYLEIDFNKPLLDNKLDHHHYKNKENNNNNNNHDTNNNIKDQLLETNSIGNGPIDSIFLNKPIQGGHGYIPNKNNNNNNNKRDEL